MGEARAGEWTRLGELGGPGKVLLELPGGNADGDEPVEVAAARDLLKETGYKAERTAEPPG
ncbi:NUDIX domain-containing protein [Streptosporangium sandarakinum]|uniref:NUDIX domain-containing protein n=1 Tax=Streptosporangium sandarakinum TaxID=1260955 RepID=UPI0033B0253C